MREARTGLGQALDELGVELADLLHVAAVLGVQHAALDHVAFLVAVARELGALAQQLGGDFEVLIHDRGRTLLAGQLQGLAPAGQRHLAGDLLGEVDRIGIAVLHAQHGERRAQAEEAHAVAALAHDLVALLFQRQAVDLHDVVEHAREHGDHLAVLVPVEVGLVSEGLAHEFGQVDRAQQAGAVRGQWLLSAGVGGADVLAEPVVVHLIDLVDEDEARLGEVVGGRHDHVPQVTGLEGAVDLAGDQAGTVGQITVLLGPLAPHDLGGVGEIDVGGLLLAHREGELPLGVVLDRLHELGGDQQGQVELAQPAVFALGADEVHDVGMADLEGGHLRAAPTAGRGDGEAHLVVDIHERQRPGGVGAGAGDVGTLGAQRGELVADAAVVDDHQAVFAGEVVVVLLDGEVVKGLADAQAAAHFLHRSQGTRKVDQLAQVRETRLPAIEPDAADDLAAVIAVIETEALTLGVIQPLAFGGQRLAQRLGQDIAIVLPRLTGMFADARALAAVGHVLGDAGEEGRVGDIEHGAAAVADDVALVEMLARAAHGDSAVDAEQAEQTLELFGKGMALRRDTGAAALGADRPIGVDQAGQEGQKMTLGMFGDPGRHPQRVGLLTNLVVDELGGTTGIEAGYGVIPHRCAGGGGGGRDTRL